MTAASQFNVLNQDDQTDSSKPLHVVYTDGIIGVGSQTVWKVKPMIDASDHLIQYSIVPLHVKQDCKVLWKVMVPILDHKLDLYFS